MIWYILDAWNADRNPFDNGCFTSCVNFWCQPRWTSARALGSWVLRVEWQELTCRLLDSSPWGEIFRLEQRQWAANNATWMWRKSIQRSFIEHVFATVICALITFNVSPQHDQCSWWWLISDCPLREIVLVVLMPYVCANYIIRMFDLKRGEGWDSSCWKDLPWRWLKPINDSVLNHLMIFRPQWFFRFAWWFFVRIQISVAANDEGACLICLMMSCD